LFGVSAPKGAPRKTEVETIVAQNNKDKVPNLVTIAQSYRFVALNNK
jgi:hypothetical protein